jgi:hypothetical protein
MRAQEGREKRGVSEGTPVGHVSVRFGWIRTEVVFGSDFVRFSIGQIGTDGEKSRTKTVFSWRVVIITPFPRLVPRRFSGRRRLRTGRRLDERYSPLTTKRRVVMRVKMLPKTPMTYGVSRLGSKESFTNQRAESGRPIRPAV